MENNCNTGIVISTTEEPCAGNYVSTNCTAIPNNITYLNLSAGDSQTKVNAALITALTFKDEQIAQLPVFDGSETKIIAGANVNITGAGTTLLPYTVASNYASASATTSGIVDNTSLQELGGGDKLINSVRIGRGTGVINDSNTALGFDVLGVNDQGDSNTGIGFRALKANTNGYSNTAVGTSSMSKNTTGENNTSIGVSSMFNNSFGFANVAIGKDSLYSNTLGGNNTIVGIGAARNLIASSRCIVVGSQAGSFLSNSTLVTAMESSIMIGTSTKPLADSQTNQIVIGHNAEGAGSNTATLGSSLIVKTVLRGTLNAANLRVFADNTSAITGGLIVGDIYRTATGDLKITF